LLSRKASRVRKEENSIKHMTVVLRITSWILLPFITVANMIIRWFLHS
jgi:hypothetical protein